MPQPRTTSRTALSRLLFLAVLGWALVALGRRSSEETEGTFAAAELGGTPAGGLEPQPASRAPAGAHAGRGSPRASRSQPSLRGRAPRPAPATCSSARWSRRRPRATRLRRPTTASAAGDEAPPRIRPRLPPRSLRRPRRRPTTARRPPRAASRRVDRPRRLHRSRRRLEPARRPTPATSPQRPRRRRLALSDHAGDGNQGGTAEAQTRRPLRRARPSSLRTPTQTTSRRAARSGGRHVRRRHRGSTGRFRSDSRPRDASRPAGRRCSAPSRVPEGPHGPRARRGSRERPHRPHSRHPGDRPVAGPPPRGDRRARRVELVPRALAAQAGPTGPRRSPATTGPSASTHSWSGSTPRSARSSGRC